MNKYKTQRGRWLKSEVTASQFVPYTYHVDDHTVKTREGDFVQMVQLDGVSFQTMDNAELNHLYHTYNQFLRTIASPARAMWSIVVRRSRLGYAQGQFSERFSKQLDARYREKLEADQFFSNELFIALVQRAPSHLPFLKNVIRRAQNAQEQQFQQAEIISDLNECMQQLLASLGKYIPIKLGIYEESGRIYSSLVEALSLVLHGEKETVPLAKRPIHDILINRRLSFGNEAFEVRNVSGTRVGGALGVKEYPHSTRVGMLDGLLSLPFEFALCQSIEFETKSAAESKMTLQRNRMQQGGDHGVSQIEEISDALDDLVSGIFVMGHHHLTFTAWATTLGQVDKQLAQAVQVFADEGFRMAREDLALQASFWAQLPGNFSMRPRVSLINSYNFAGFTSLHNYPCGNARGNHWGPAVATLKTESGTPYFFNFHRSDSRMGDDDVTQDAEVDERRVNKWPAGNTTVIGPVGSGKTAFLTFMIAQADKFKPRVAFFDIDRGAEIFLRAHGGVYTAIKVGRSTGFNPLQLELTPGNIAFMKDFVRTLVTEPNQALTADEKTEISQAIDSLIHINAREERRLATLASFFDVVKENSLASRLERWHSEGELAWCFDSPMDQLSLDARIFGFDMTEVIDRAEVRGPMAAYLFHRIDQLITGERFMVFIDEGWKYTADDIFSAMMLKWQKTIRKQNGVVVMATQRAGEAADSSIGNDIVEQSPTKVFFPNHEAKHEHYVDKFGLTEKEFNIVKTLNPSERKFLIKQGTNSVVAILDLTGMDEFIPVLSGSTANVMILDQIRAAHGDDPQQWMPEFLARVN